MKDGRRCEQGEIVQQSEAWERSQELDWRSLSGQFYIKHLFSTFLPFRYLQVKSWGCLLAVPAKRKSTKPHGWALQTHNLLLLRLPPFILLPYSALIVPPRRHSNQDSMARVKESNRDGEASKKRTASSNASVVTPSKSTKRSGAVVRKKIKKGRKTRAFEKKKNEFSGPFMLNFCL